MLLLVDSTEHTFSSFEFAKPFGSTQFLYSKYQYGSEFSQIGTPHFSLGGVLQELSANVTAYRSVADQTKKKVNDFQHKTNNALFTVSTYDSTSQIC